MEPKPVNQLDMKLYQLTASAFKNEPDSWFKRSALRHASEQYIKILADLLMDTNKPYQSFFGFLQESNAMQSLSKIRPNERIPK
jgi:hypothetical protein